MADTDKYAETTKINEEVNDRSNCLGRFGRYVGGRLLLGC